AIAALGLGYMSTWLAKLPVLVTTFALDGITGTVHGLGGLRMADLRVAMPSLLISAFAAGVLALAMWASRRRAWITVSGLGGILVASIFLAYRPADPRIRPG